MTYVDIPAALQKVPPIEDPFDIDVDGDMSKLQLEAYLSQLDQEVARVSGLNDLLVGAAPASVQSAKTAINAVVGQYTQGIISKKAAQAILASAENRIPPVPDVGVPGTERDEEAARKLLGPDYVDPVIMAGRVQMSTALLSAIEQIKANNPEVTRVIVHPKDAAEMGL